MAQSRISAASKLAIPLRSILLVPFLLQIVGTISLVGVLSFRNGNLAVGSLAEQLREDATERVKEHLKAYLKPPAMAVRSNAIATELNQFSIDQLDSARVYFAEQLKLHSSFDGIYLANEQGQFLCLCGASRNALTERQVVTAPKRQHYAVKPDGTRGNWLKEDHYDPRVRPWYRLAKQVRQPVWSEVYAFTDGELGLAAAAPIFDSDGALTGVAGIDLRLAQLNQFLAQIEPSPNAEVYITDAQGLMIGSSGDSQIMTAETDSSRAQTNQGATSGSPEPQRLRADHSASPIIRATAQHLKTQAQAQPQAGPKTEAQAASQLEAQHEMQSRLAHAMPSTSEFEQDNERYFVQSVPYRDALGLDWRIVVVMPESDFMAQIHASTRTTIQLCLLALLLSAGLGGLLARRLSKPLQRASLGAKAIATGQFQHRLPQSRVREVNLLSQAFEQMAYQLQASFSALEDANTHLETRVQQRTAELAAEQEKSEKLLLNILPACIAQKLKQSQQPIAQSFEQVTILFADLVGFTPLAARYSAPELVALLNQLFCQFDELVEQYQLEKIKTIGDAYMVAGGLPQAHPNAAEAIADLAIEMKNAMTAFNQTFGQDLDNPLDLRIGINTGTVVGGVIGTKKFTYDVWGDAVNIASRMESSSQAGQIQISEVTYQLLHQSPSDSPSANRYTLEKRGEVEIKGRGRMTTYWLRGWAGEKCRPAVSPTATPIHQPALPPAAEPFLPSTDMAA